MRREAEPAGSPTETTVSDGQPTTSDDRDREPRRPEVLAITVLYHPDVRRIGDRLLVPWRLGTRVAISRRGPEFVDPAGRPAGPLADRGVSRRPITLVCTADGLRLEPEGELPYRLAGSPVDDAVSLPRATLAQGVVLECARRVLLWIDAWVSPPAGGEIVDLWGVSAATERLRGHIASLAPHDLPVSITGESGTGKELVARALHAGSPRVDRPWVTVNVGALNASTAAADLFGHARGAFTGAETARPGFFRRAEGGTLFLDEIGSLPQSLQPMLLRALESGEIQPVGEPPRRVDVRLVTATDADLERLSETGHFFRPLLYRIRTTRIALPPLRERPADIPLLFTRFVAAQLDSLGALDRLEDTEEPWLSRRMVETLLRHRWPGNVRELRNLALQTALENVAAPQARLPSHFAPDRVRDGALSDPVAMLREVTHSPAVPPMIEGRDWAVPPEALVEALRRNDWRVRPVADELGIARNTVYAMMGRLGIRRPGDLTRQDILAMVEAEGTHDTARLAERLQVSERGLKLRIRALGLVLD